MTSHLAALTKSRSRGPRQEASISAEARVEEGDELMEQLLTPKPKPGLNELNRLNWLNERRKNFAARSRSAGLKLRRFPNLLYRRFPIGRAPKTTGAREN